MMKTRKLLAVLLSLALAIGLMAPAAMAAENVIDSADELYAAAAAGGSYKLGANLTEIPTAVEITKTVTIDLNGYTVKTVDTAGNGVFWVKKDGVLTLDDSSDAKTGTVNGVAATTQGYHMAIWANGGEVIINGGNYTNVGANTNSTVDDQYDMIYAGSSQGGGGTITINGGTFASETPKWTLNTNDTNGSIVVKGGTFVGYNPAAVYTEPTQPKNFVADGCFVEQSGSDYTVKALDATIDSAAELYAAAAAGGSYKLGANLTEIPTAVEITKTVTIDLNGYTVKTVDTAGNGVFWVKKDGVLTLDDSSDAKTGTVNGVAATTQGYHMAIWANGGEVIINGGNYTNVGANTNSTVDDQYDMIYAGSSQGGGGTITINGGTFASETPKWTLNTNDTNGSIVVKGGTFVGYNPAAVYTEPTQPKNFVADGYVAMEEVGGTYGVYPAVPVSYVTGTSTTIDGQIVSPGYTFVLPAAPSRGGYTFTGWNDGSATYSAGAEYTVDDYATSVTLTALWTQNVTSGGGGGSSSSSTTTTEKNPDGSTTTTTTNKTTGTVTETTKTTDGVTVTTTTDKAGDVTSVTANVPAAAAKEADKAGEPVTLPIEVQAGNNSAEATEIKVNVPSTGATVEIPVENVTPGTVVIIVNADGTESIVPLTTLTEDGVVVTLEDDATIKVVDNSKDFTDVPDDYALADSIDFVSARGLFEGNTESTFNPHADTTIAQTMTVLARLSGEDFYGAGSTTKGAEWATEKGLSDGTDVSKAITREQMVVMMWKLAGMPESDQVLTASDVNDISADALAAMQWAVEMGILKGNLDGTLNPNGNASRAHVAAFTERYVNALAN